MSTHTPGPWEYVLHDDGETSGVTFEIRMGSRLGGRNGWEPQHQIEYNAPDSGKQFAEAKANARLIAAAPELLEACRAFVTAHDKSLQLEKTDVALRLARAAIQSATGA